MTMTTKELIRRHGEVMSQAQGVYHDVSFVSGEGSYLYDCEGKKYIDMTVGICTGPVGHCHPEVVEVIKDQADKLLHTSMIGYYKENVEHAELLRQTAPGALKDGRVIFLNGGSEGNEAALKMARMVTRRPLVISFMGSFHGRPMGAVACTGSKASYKKGISGLLAGVHHAVYPYCYRCPMGHKSQDTCGMACINIVHKLLKHVVPKEDLAAIILEPMAGEAGYVYPPTEFVRELRRICDETGALLIADEVQTGLGRTGKMWSIEHHDVVPDAIVFGKAAGGQLPLGGVIAKREFMDQWEEGSHGSTYGGHPISCRAGMKTVEIILREKLYEHADEIGKKIVDKLNAVKDDIPAIGDVRGKGLMVGVELIKADGSANKDLTMKVMAETAKRGAIYTNIADSIIRICPPLNIDWEDADQAIDILIATIRDLQK